MMIFFVVCIFSFIKSSLLNKTCETRPLHRKIYSSIADLVGNTPIVRLNRIVGDQPHATVAVKIEYFNPGLSVKDRVGFAMIDAAEKEGLITPGKSTIIEPTSGNTGIGLSLAGVVKGYNVITVMSEAMSNERRTTVAIMSAEVVLTPAVHGIDGAVAKANELARNINSSFIPQQFENPNNPLIHQQTTGPEIWYDTDGQVDVVVGGIGTGGTITGVSRFLKSKKSSIKIIGVEPAESPVLSGGPPGQHNIQGIGTTFIPRVLDLKTIDEIFPVSTADSIITARRLAKEEGIMCGVSSGAAAFAALELSKRPEYFGKLIVAILPDHGLRYLSHPLYAPSHEEMINLSSSSAPPLASVPTSTATSDSPSNNASSTTTSDPSSNASSSTARPSASAPNIGSHVPPPPRF